MERRILFLGKQRRSPVEELKFRGVRRFAGALGWRVEESPLTGLPSGGIAALLRTLRPSGCIVECSGSDGFPPPRLFGRVPAVWLDTPPDAVGAVARRGVMVDNAAVAEAAFRELATTRPAAFAAISAHNLPWAAARLRAFCALARKWGHDCEAFFTRPCAAGPVDLPGLAQWLAALPRPCGVFAANDYAARAALSACALARLHVPRDISLVGVDDCDSTPRNATEKPLTSIRIDFELMGYKAARLLGEAIAVSSHRGAGKTEPQRKNPARRPQSPQSNFETEFSTNETGRTSHEASPIIVVGPLMVARRATTSGRGRHEPSIDEAVAMIRAEACVGLTAAALAARFPGTRRLFDIRFREAVGHSALDEILHVRLEKVCELLSLTTTPVTAICDFCGFRRHQTLDKLFRQRFGLSMGEWRSRNSCLRRG